MADVLYAAEIWLLLATLLIWMFSRAATRLRQPPPSLAEVLIALQAYADERAPSESAATFDVGELWRAVRIYERA